MGNASDETIRSTLNASAITNGSAATSTTAAYLAADVTHYTGGLTLKNTDADITLWYRVGGVAAVAGATSDALTAGERIPVAWGDVSTISVIAESGTPRVSWSGTTL